MQHQPKQSPRKLTPKQREALIRRRKQLRRRRNIFRVVLSVVTFLLLVLGALVASLAVMFRGPSPTFGDILTVSMQETSALKFVPRLFYSDEEMNAIFARNEVAEQTEETDTSLIVIAPPTPAPTAVPADDGSASLEAIDPNDPTNGIEVEVVRGGSYVGYMMIIQDPSRVTVGTCADEFTSKPGKQLKDIAARYNAIAAINGGGFVDDGGHGNGGQPSDIVISEGKLMKASNRQSGNDVVIGFNQDNVLIVGKMSSKEAQEKGIRDALVFGPALIVNGEAASVKGASSGLNPRTAIGQRADGAVLMLVIDGRQASSLGATYSDMIKLLLEYGAVNAANLDGGSSSLMYYQGEYLNNGVVLTGSRNMPTAFIVR